MRRLVKSWIEVEKSRGNSLAAAIRDLNNRHGMQITHSRVAEWRRGIHVPSRVVLSDMLTQVLPWALSEAGVNVSEDQLLVLESLIWEIKEEDGGYCIELL